MVQATNDLSGYGSRADAAPRHDYLGWAQTALRAFILNAAWVLGCATILCAPAATTALLTAIRRWRADGEPPTARAFVRDVGRRFWCDLISAMVLLIIAAVAALDLMVIGRMGSQRRVVLVLWMACTIGMALGSVLVTVVASADLYAGGGRMPVRRTMSASWRLAAAHPLRAALVLVVIVAAAGLVSVSPICLLGVGIVVAAVIDLIIYGQRSVK